ncbi:DUF1709-domain-containing protein [Massarina eburnea CBS 473.64]|uniref:DUF1709-domain-containing protein n=1 Tax=Massarina eburnea CBS 473.64 TaxID=1395130 RepID=A0A6A6RVT3_9PLEO|nr:DUF1709-domain-containing protein [Massarina eburnea CBS 473.64]
MSRNEAVSPLRITKTPTASPTKSGMSRPLSEIGSTEHRRNSPNFNSPSKRLSLAKEASPFDSSPFPNSPRLFWKEQTVSPKTRFGSENDCERDSSPAQLSPKRGSIENLKKASRVKNSSMFAREQKNEYDPSSVQVPSRPLAAGRPLSTQIQGNAYGGSGLNGLRQENDSHRRGESLTKIPNLSPFKPSSPTKMPLSSSPTRDPSTPPSGRMSPGKSSLVSPSRYESAENNQDSSVWSEDEGLKQQTPRPLRRHAKSVTFDAAPPTINEYEMVTPDPSSIASGSRDGSYDSDEEELSFDQDDSFDASLEDTDKTPVVLPEDWRHTSPTAADADNDDDDDDDVFDDRDKSPIPNARPNIPARPDSARHGSTASDGESRPLPPLPGMPAQDSPRRNSGVGLSDPAERASVRRSLPHPPQAAGVSKADLLNMRETSMSLEDRLRLMHFEDDRDTDTPTQESQDKKIELNLQDEVAEVDDATESDATVDGPKTPRISRESILRKVQSRNFDQECDSYNNFSYDVESNPDRSYGELADLDPDVPIPSRECSSNFDDHPPQSEADSVIDAYSFGEGNDLYGEMSPYHTEEQDEEQDEEEDEDLESSVIHHDIGQHADDEEDDDSQYSLQPEEQPTIDTSGPSTPTVGNSSLVGEGIELRQKELLPASDDEEETDVDPLKSSFQTPLNPLDTAPKIDAMHQFLPRPQSPDGDVEAGAEDDAKSDVESDVESDAESEADSVIRHPIAIEPPEDDTSSISETEATIRGAGGGKLRTRPSLLPCDLDMAAARRQVSGERRPPLPDRSPNRHSLNIDISNIEEDDSQLGSSNKENLMLDLKLGDDSHDLSFGLDKEFDNIIEAQKVDDIFPIPSFAQFPTSSAAHQDGASLNSGEGFVYKSSLANDNVYEKKGYLMRQNTKVVVASSRFSDDKPSVDQQDPVTAAKAADSNSRKTSAERKPAWTTEPWNGKMRRRSIRTTSQARRAAESGPVPPMPGQESAAGGLNSVAEQGQDDFDDGEARGLVFVKVVGVKDLDLPLPKTERTHFQLTLDNGLHCVTTQWLELNRSAPIGQEFELVVLDDLEFQLTLQTKLEPPAKPVVTAAVPAPVKTVNHKKSHSAFRNLLSSPKKRKEQERKQQEEAQRLAQQQQQEAQAKKNQQTTAWDLLHNLVGPDGSFARAYVCLNTYEEQAYGRPLTVDIPCFNEWAVDDSAGSSVKSKRGGVVRRPPYRVGKITLQLLYVPKPKKSRDEDMPKSMNACIRELKEAEEIKEKAWEGLLSQQGGDCPYWRRRFFRLNGTKLVAYHETTGQMRATISLAKATKLIDDRTSLKQPSSTKNGGRRKSGFAEEEEGYMFVEEGFRIRFANGEVIDFYADNAEQKAGWMRVLVDCVGQDTAANKRGWAEMVLEKERREKARPSSQSKGQTQRPRSHEGVGSSQAAPSSPVKPRPSHSRTRSHVPVSHNAVPPPPIEKDARHKSGTTPRARDAPKANRRDQVRSMIF